MEKVTLEVPTMYGDHHVLEVRRILLEIPGVDEVYASSSFHVVDVAYDPEKVSPDLLTGKLSQAGYTDELPMPVEVGAVPEPGNGKRPFFRHTAIYETTKSTVSFAQNVSYQGRPLWPCPGMGPIATHTPEEE